MHEQYNEEKIDVKKALRVFQVILDRGELFDGEYHFQGLRADPGVDGYAVTIRNDYCELVIQFHSNFTFNFWGDVERDKFLDKLDQIEHEFASVPVEV